MAGKAIEDKNYWAKHVKNYGSGRFRSKQAYCRQLGIDYNRFLYWRRKLTGKLTQEVGPSQRSLLMPVVAVPHQSPKSETHLCTLEFKQGHQLRIHNESVLEKLINLLSK